MTSTFSSSPGPSSPARRRVLVGGLWSASAQVVPLAGTMALSVVMGRVLGPAELGTQSFVVFVEALLASLLIGSWLDVGVRTLSTSLGRAEGAEGADDDGAGHLTYWVMVGQGVLGGLVAAVLVVVGLLRPAETLLWLLVALTALANAATWAYATRVIAVQGWARVGRLRLVSQSASALAGIAAVLGGLGLPGVLGASLLAAVVPAALLPRRVPGPRPARGPLPAGVLRLWGSFVAVELVTQVVARRVEFLVLDVRSTAVQVALYSVPFMVVTAATAVTSSFFAAAMPAVARAGAARIDGADGTDGADGVGGGRLQQHVGPAGRVVLTLSVPLTALVAVLGPPLVLLAYGEAFRAAAVLVPLLALTALTAPALQLCLAYWGGTGSLRVPVLLMAAGGAVDVLLAVALVPSLGATGAAVANVVGQSTAAVLVLGHTWHRVGRFPVGRRQLLVAAGTSALAAAGAVACLALLDGVPGLLAAAVVALALLGLGARLLGLVSAADAAWLAAALPARARPVLSWVTGGRS